MASRPDAAAGSATVEETFAEAEEETIRLKSLSDLTFPSPPENAAQTRGYINRVLMSIGKVQRTAGDEVYIWTQECMTLTESQLKADLRFPRLSREISAKPVKEGRFGLSFQQQVEQECTRSGTMLNGRCMLCAIFRHFQLERDRQRLQNAICLTQGLQGDLFRDRYLYVLTTTTDADLRKPSTMFNHLTDELDKCPTLRQKVEKARESRPGSHKRTTKWLWNRVDIALELHQQKINCQEFDRTLKRKPQVLGPNTQLPKGADPNAAPALTDPNIPAAPATREQKQKKKRKKKKKKEVPEAPATPAAKGRGKGKGASTPRRTPCSGGKGGDKGDATPRSEQARRASQMTKEEKARTPGMFYGLGSCKAAKCEFLLDDSNRYTGPPPRSLAAPKADAKAKPKPKPKPKAKAAAIAPLINAMPAAQSRTRSPGFGTQVLADTSSGSRLSKARWLHVCAVRIFVLTLPPVRCNTRAISGTSSAFSQVKHLHHVSSRWTQLKRLA